MVAHAKLGLVVSVAAVTLIAADRAEACSCAPLTRDSFERADAAVVARLDEIDRHPIPGSDNYGPADFKYTLTRVYKSRPRLEVGDRLVIESHTSSAACGMPGREGQKTAFLVDRHRDEWRSSLCASTSREGMRRLANRGDRVAPDEGEGRQPGDCG